MAGDEKDWMELANPFPGATAATQEYLEQLAPEDFVESRMHPDEEVPTMSFLDVLKVLVPDAMRSILAETSGDYWDQGEAMIIQRLGEALDRLQQGKLTMRDNAQLDLITMRGIEALGKYEQGISQDILENEAGYTMADALGHLTQDCEYERLEIDKRDLMFVTELREGLESIAMTLMNEMAYQRRSVELE